MAVALIIFVLLALPLASAIAILWIVQRRRRPYPACGRCRYDVSGSIGSVTRCPECGVAFAEGGILPPRRVSRALVGLTIAVPVFFATFVSLGVAHQMATRRALAARLAVMQAQTQAAAAAAQAAEAEVDEEATDGQEPDAP